MAHILPTRIYYAVFATLLVLTGVTVWVATHNWGNLNILVAITIAVTKALLVILYFMHVRYTARLTRLFVAAGFFWLVILLSLTMGDYLTRGQLFFPGGW